MISGNGSGLFATSLRRLPPLPLYLGIGANIGPGVLSEGGNE